MALAKLKLNLAVIRTWKAADLLKPDDDKAVRVVIGNPKPLAAVPRVSLSNGRLKLKGSLLTLLNCCSACCVLNIFDERIAGANNTSVFLRIS